MNEYRTEKFRMMKVKGAEQEKKYDLENRLIDFAVRIIKLVESLPNIPVGKYIEGQLLCYGTSPAPNYGEAQSAESRKDFVHKMRVCLKKLYETRAWLIILRRLRLLGDSKELEWLIAECNELISIFVTSIRTATKNRNNER
jgi:four helix bundle protein